MTEIESTDKFIFEVDASDKRIDFLEGHARGLARRIDELQGNSERRAEQWQRCFRLAFALKNKYYKELRSMTADRDSETRWACQYKAERDELQKKINAMLECVQYTDLEWRTRERSQLSWAYVDVKNELKRRLTAIAEGRTP